MSIYIAVYLATQRAIQQRRMDGVLTSIPISEPSFRGLLVLFAVFYC
jgi:hypothetical protein